MLRHTHNKTHQARKKTKTKSSPPQHHAPRKVAENRPRCALFHSSAVNLTTTAPTTSKQLELRPYGVFHTKLNMIPTITETTQCTTTPSADTTTSSSSPANDTTITMLSTHLDHLNPAGHELSTKLKQVIHNNADHVQRSVLRRVNDPNNEYGPTEGMRFSQSNAEYTYSYENLSWSQWSAQNSFHYAAIAEHLQTSLYKYHKSQRNQLSSLPSSPHTQPPTHHPLQPIYTPAFALDIDGVLLRGGQVIPDVIPALRQLFSTENGGTNPYQIPTVFMTNGGGVTEAEKAAELSRKFQLNIAPEQVVLSHTPFKALTKTLGEKKIVIMGGRASERVAKTYGFNNSESINNLREEFCDLLAPQSVQDDVKKYNQPTDVAKAVERVSGVDGLVIWTDPREWYSSIQCALDILIQRREAYAKTHNVPIGTYKARKNIFLDHFKHIPLNKHIEENILSAASSDPSSSSLNNGITGPLHSIDPEDYLNVIHTLHDHYKPVHTPIWTSNPDFLYSNRYTQPRLAQSGFAETLSYLYTRLTGEQLEFLTIGKPTLITYRYVEGLLLQQAQHLSKTTFNHQPVVIYRNFGVGDNPKADIRGANAAGGDLWSSVFVHTGTLPLKSPDVERDFVHNVTSQSDYDMEVLSETPALHYPSIHECINEVLLVNNVINDFVQLNRQ